MNTLYERLKGCRTHAGLTQQQLAKAVGVSHVTISQWERGDTTPKGSNLYQLAKVLNCSAEWLLYGLGEMPSNTVNLLANVTDGPIIKGSYPLISWQQAGNWTQVHESYSDQATQYSCPVNCSEQTFVLKVQGVSMEPIFHDGDLVFVDPNLKYKHGSYVIVRLDGHHEATFRQLIVEGGHHYLKPINPNWPEPIISLTGHSHVVGVVIFSGRIF
ncbi:LexA family protein [Celerinatantimonas yamalensis]|uniref:S24 family peptidase n=1 Tax=Celerinatantimonas yamalensis TaxID=559956 RepID=A0ABW9G598_9GAMM